LSVSFVRFRAPLHRSTCWADPLVG
jgi:hypothetical protein